MQRTYTRSLRLMAWGVIPAALVVAACAQPAEKDLDPKPVNTPVWTTAMADQFPDCVSSAKWDRTHHHLAKDDLGRIPLSVITVDLSGTATRMDTDAAWDRAPKASGSMWIVGACTTR